MSAKRAKKKTLKTSLKKSKKAKKKSAKKVEKEPTRDELSPQDKLFCTLYASDREFFGNGVQSYAEAFGKDIHNKGQYKVCSVLASRLLVKVSILAYINKLLEVTLNDAHVDKQLAFLITQNADLSVKIAAIREYNALKTRIVKKMEVGGADGGPIKFDVTLKKTYKKK